MGWTDDEIDNLAKNASNNQKVEYKNVYWKEMEALLDAKKPVKKRFGWWFFGVMIFLLTITGSGFYYMSQNVGIGKEIILAYGITDVQENERLIALSQKENDSFKLERNKFVNEQLTPIIATKINTLEYKASSSASFSQSDLNPLKNSYLNVDSFDGSGEKDKTEQNDKTKEKFELATFTVSRNIFSDLETGKNFQSDDQEVNEQATEVGKAELLENNVAKNMAEDPTSQRKTGFYVAAGAGAGTSYIKTPNELMIQWRVNMGVDYTIANNFRFGVGMGFRQQLVNNLTVERSREYYSFGLIDVNQSINYDRLQFVDLNLHAHYLFRKVAVGIEITPSYLMSVRAAMKQTQIEYDHLFVDEIVTTKSEKQFVRTENFNSFGLDAGISFQYQFKYKMSIQAVASTRLNRMLKNEDFRGEQNRFPVKLEMGLIKRF